VEKTEGKNKKKEMLLLSAVSAFYIVYEAVFRKN
jgi:hypothetical protein